MTIERLTSYFQIKSLGPNCYLNSFKIEIEKSKFENSHGVLGSGVYI